MSPKRGGFGEGRLVDTGGGTVKLRLPCAVPVEGEATDLDDRPPSRPDFSAVMDNECTPPELRRLEAAARPCPATIW